MHKSFHHIYGIAIICMMVAMFVFQLVRHRIRGEVDELNQLSYALHYRNLDSTKVLAEKALALFLKTILPDTRRLATTWLLWLLPRWITILPNDGLTR